MMLITHLVVDPKRRDRPAEAGTDRNVLIDLNAEYIELRNETTGPEDIRRWQVRKRRWVVSDGGGDWQDDPDTPAFIFPDRELWVMPGRTVRVYSGAGSDRFPRFYWGQSTPLWNQVGDTVALLDATETLVDQRHYPTLAVGFRADPSPLGDWQITDSGESRYQSAIALTWSLPILRLPGGALPVFPEADDLPLIILRRQGRFPGQNRKGVIPVEKQLVTLPPGVTPADRSALPGAFLTGAEDGFWVYDTASFFYDFEAVQREWTRDRHLITTIRQYRYRQQPQDPQDRILVRLIRQESQPLSPTDDTLRPVSMTVQYLDRRGLTPGSVYAYTAFAGPADRPLFSAQTQASALASDWHGHRFFTSLPQVHQRFDTVMPPQDAVARRDRDKGQLQRFMEVFEAHSDLLHSRIQALQPLHQPQRVESRFLPPLAHLIGWHPRDYLDEAAQRNEIAFAPTLYKTIGTLPALTAAIGRLIRWKAEVYEFAHNVLLSIDESRLEQRDGDWVYLNGSADPPRRPAGAIDLSDADAIALMGTRRDPVAYSYDLGRPDGRGGYERDNLDRFVLYNRETIGLYLSPYSDADILTLEQAIASIRSVLTEFLPVQVRVVFILEPAAVDEIYDAPAAVAETSLLRGLQAFTSIHDAEVLETGVRNRVSGWELLVANHPDHRTNDLVYRTWHIALDQPRADLPAPPEEDP